MCWSRHTTDFFLIGAILFYSCSNIPENKQVPDWEKDVKTIIEKRCSECHQPQGAGPFSLLTYENVKSKANRIRYVLENNIMPPWPADTNYRRFLYEKIISSKEKEILLKWIEFGCPSDSTKPLSKISPNVIKHHPKPDLAVHPASYPQLAGDGKDAFLIVKFPYTLPCDTWLDFVRFVPHQKKWVHHVNGHLIQFDATRKLPDYYKGVPWYKEVRDSLKNIYRNMHLTYTDKKSPEFPLLTPNVVYYLPGYFPLKYPEWVGGWKLSKHGVFLMNNLHYGPSPDPLTDSSYLEIYYRKSKPLRPIRELQMGTLGISPIIPPLVIPPNTIKSFTTQAMVSQKISLLSVNPHMHLLGKSFKAFAISPSGDTIPLIRIPKWDFRWQYYYTFPKPVVLDKGSRIVVIATYDNTSDNPFNPNFPPKEVSEGMGSESMRTTDEMLQFIFTFVPYEAGDEEKILFREN
ncbi:MAG: hypothetical protein N3F09_01830 [Bacteroidia bacterium]|nr:hypothetical protein [Bacteroidia bacterium]